MNSCHTPSTSSRRFTRASRSPPVAMCRLLSSFSAPLVADTLVERRVAEVASDGAAREPPAPGLAHEQVVVVADLERERVVRVVVCDVLPHDARRRTVAVHVDRRVADLV